MENKSSNYGKIMLITICIVIGIAIGGIIAKSINTERYNAINMLYNAAEYSNSAKYGVAAGIGEIEAQNTIYIGNIIGGIGGLFLGLIISASKAKKKNISEIQKYDLISNSTNNTNRYVRREQITPLNVKLTNVSPSVKSLLRRAEIFLEDGDFNSADKYFDRVLDIDPECAKAYIGRLLVELKLKSENELANCGAGLTENGNYKRAIKFADESYKEILSKYKEN